MRLDYALYIIAIAFFLLTGFAALTLTLAESERPLWVVTTAILGLLSIGLGYSQRPKIRATAIEAPPPTTPTVTEVVEKKTPLDVAPSKIKLTEVKGIGEKRAEQLKALGISSIEDLVKASAEDLAVKLKISPKITGRWIEGAKKLTEK
jgi:predicted flap endonuclease-1-like 5' DNA nuclease